MIVELLELLGPYGPSGMVIAYLLWREHRRDGREEDRQKYEKERAEKDEQIRKDQAEADKELAVALTLLSERVSHVRAL